MKSSWSSTLDREREKNCSSFPPVVFNTHFNSSRLKETKRKKERWRQEQSRNEPSQLSAAQLRFRSSDNKLMSEQWSLLSSLREFHWSGNSLFWHGPDPTEARSHLMGKDSVGMFLRLTVVVLSRLWLKQLQNIHVERKCCFLKITRNDPTCRITPEILIWFEKMFFYTFISWNLHRRCWAKSSITWWCVSTERGEEDWINIFGWTVPLRGGLFGPNSIWNMSFSGRQFCEAPSKERRVCCKEVSFDPALNR